MRTFVLLLLLTGFLFCFHWIFSYDTYFAHPFLTERAIGLFNQNSGAKITERQLGWIRQGAIEEDEPIRWMNHFFNPETGRGLGAFASAKNWSQSGITQSVYPKGNQTWQKAIELYANGDEQGAFVALGHISYPTKSDFVRLSENNRLTMSIITCRSGIAPRAPTS